MKDLSHRGKIVLKPLEYLACIGYGEDRMREIKTTANSSGSTVYETTSTAPVVSVDRREHRRFKPTVTGAFIYIDKRLPLIDCEVMNLSDGGAKICALTQFMIPAHFLLFFTQDGSLRRSCKVIWRDGQTIGIAFED